MDNLSTSQGKWYQKSVEDTLDSLQSNKNGLTESTALGRLDMYGANKLPESKPPSYLILFLRQFQNPLIYVLIIAAVIVFAIGHLVDALVISIVLIINAIVGSIQEGKAADALSALRNFTKTQSQVIRDGKELIVNAEDIVPGDIILLQSGDKIPADSRIISLNHFQTEEATLTGESFPIEKTTDILNEDNLEAADMRNMVFRGTYVVSGTARAVVCSTGINTIIGNLSQDLTEVNSEIPLKKNIDRLAKAISVIIIIVSTLIFLAGIFIGKSIDEMFLTAVAISVSVIPEGLPIVITLVLATGVNRMGKQNALVKRLQAVEALGRADVIAVDKTGTITKNELMVSEVYINSKFYKVSGSGFEREGNITLNGEEISVSEDKDLQLAAKIASFCANADAIWNDQDKLWKVTGDPTEVSFNIFAEKAGFIKKSLEKENPLILDMPFSFKNKFHGTVHKTNKGNFLTIVGAPEGIITSAEYVYEEGVKRKITSEDRQKFVNIVSELATRGLRVVAFAINENTPEIVTVEVLPDLTLVGIYALSDTLREGVADSIRLAKNDGIRVALITGDYLETAKALGRSAGIYNDGDEVITGKELQEMDQKVLLEKLATTTVFARVSPKDKLRIVELYKNSGNIIAMTGDGVNDALSLVAADLGIAMGRIGTEVTKEASDIVLLDDNFKTIVTAIEEGKSIFNTVRKVLLYLFSTGVGELLVIILALFALIPLPLLPSQIIWLNLVTDSFLVMAFAFEPREKITSKSEKQKNLIDSILVWRVIIMGAVMGIGSLILFNVMLDSHSVTYARTMTLTLLAVYQWVNVWNCRREKKSIFSENPFSNIYFLWALIIVFVLQMLLLYAPFMQTIFSTVPLSLSDWGLIMLFALPLIAVEEMRKLIFRVARNKE